MSTGQFELLTKIQEFVTDHFRQKVDAGFVFHNLTHTQEVVSAAEEMAEHYGLSEEDRFVLSTAAWFHDSGFASGTAMGHEAESVRIATEFLVANRVASGIIQKVTSCIDATHMPQSPTSLAASILCDADLFHLGTGDFLGKSKLLRQEINMVNKEKINKKVWRKKNIEFLESHSYFTDYCKEKLEPVKQAHLLELNKKIYGKAATAEKTEKTEKKQNKKEKTPEKEDKKKKEKDALDKSERGISTMFRIMSNSQNTLSGMADSKANIMISVNSIIISIVLSGLLTVVISNPHLSIPFFLLIIVCVTTIVFSILATRPKITRGTFTQDDIYNKKVNLLFFGNFYNMKLSEYEWGMKEMLYSRDYLYDSMIKDIYFLGIVLAKKYKYLRISYNIFMYGLILVMIAFALSIIFFKRAVETLG